MVKRILSIALILFFLLAEYVFSDQLLVLHPYGLYGFEIAFALLGCFLFRADSKISIRFDRKLVVQASVFLVSGLLVYFGSTLFGFSNPIDGHDQLMLVLLLVYAPIVEEILFRLAIWGAVKRIYDRSWLKIGVTAALFSFAHFYSYFYIEDAYKPFVIYQTAYTFGLAVFLGRAREKTGSVLYSILFHFLFNLGFTIAGLMAISKG